MPNLKYTVPPPIEAVDQGVLTYAGWLQQPWYIAGKMVAGGP